MGTAIQKANKPKLQKLTDQHKEFVDYYIVTHNATKAYMLVYKDSDYNAARTSAYRLLNKPKIKAYLDETREQLSQRVMLNQEDILNELKRVAFADLSDYVSWDANGVMLIDYKKVDGSVVSEVSETVTEHGGTQKIKLHDKMKALELLGKYFGIFNDDKETASQTQILNQLIISIQSRAGMVDVGE